mmetsp:Transcript_63378/g.169499  ORF Transcript_63378/g.169499 Transcript_63378/m.169499 type:complete len:291 (+) Transcript_63378:694-1566(+)
MRTVAIPRQRVEHVPCYQKAVRNLRDSLAVARRLAPPLPPGRPAPVGRQHGRRLDRHHHRPQPQARLRPPRLLAVRRRSGGRGGPGVDRVEEALKEGVMVLCDDVPVPQVGVSREAEAQAVRAEGHVLPTRCQTGDAPELPHGRDVPPHPRGQRAQEVVPVRQLRRLPHGPILLVPVALAHRAEIAAHPVKVARVKQTVGVRDREDARVHGVELLLATLVRPAHGVLQVRGLPGHLGGLRAVGVMLHEVAGVEGGLNPLEALPEVGDEALPLSLALVTLALLHGQEYPEL